MRSGPGGARIILLLHIISARPSKQPLMVRTFLKVYMELGSSFLFLQEQKKKTSSSSCVYYTCIAGLKALFVYYCRTYYKAVRVGEEESGGHVL